jgi:hypothetical protein
MQCLVFGLKTQLYSKAKVAFTAEIFRHMIGTAEGNERRLHFAHSVNVIAQEIQHMCGAHFLVR